uniref:Uncharacterized protein n=1 Tax=Tanacetum cinerariifolium TaxID=118510 RepID=A0A699QFJ7_TANCI|nr:hypothetical protein [Tanacetum cinerariifolium]
MAMTENIAPPDAIGSGPTMSIPYWEKGHAELIGVISCFNFLGMDEWIWKASLWSLMHSAGALVYFLEDAPCLYWPDVLSCGSNL